MDVLLARNRPRPILHPVLAPIPFIRESQNAVPHTMDARYNLPTYVDPLRNDASDFHFPQTSQWPNTSVLPIVEVKAEDDPDSQYNNGHEGTTSSPCDFVKKLYRILEDESIINIISWGPKGDRFIVKDINEFAKVVLPRTFKHSNFSSFVRQLNKYDFHKVKEMDDSFEDGEEHWTFRHPEFHTNGRDKLENIKRKAPGQRARNFGSPSPPSPLDYQCSTLTMMQNELSSLGAAHEQVLCHVRDLERNYRDVLTEMLCFQRCMAQQDGIMQNLMCYLRDNDVDALRRMQKNGRTERPSASPRMQTSQQMLQLSKPVTDLEPGVQMDTVARSGCGCIEEMCTSPTPAGNGSGAGLKRAYQSTWPSPPGGPLVEYTSDSGSDADNRPLERQYDPMLSSDFTYGVKRTPDMATLDGRDVKRPRY